MKSKVSCFASDVKRSKRISEAVWENEGEVMVSSHTPTVQSFSVTAAAVVVLAAAPVAATAS